MQPDDTHPSANVPLPGAEQGEATTGGAPGNGTPSPGRSPQALGSLDEREKRIQEDYEWCLHDPEVRRRYGGRVVVVQNRKVWGVGSNHGAALDAALAAADCPFRNSACPSREAIAIVVVPEYVPDRST
jgi:hypothetical protein